MVTPNPPMTFDPWVSTGTKTPAPKRTLGAVTRSTVEAEEAAVKIGEEESIVVSGYEISIVQIFFLQTFFHFGEESPITCVATRSPWGVDK